MAAASYDENAVELGLQELYGFISSQELEKGESMNPNWEVKRTGLIKVSTLEGVAGGSQWVREEYAEAA